jgi:hypothetical protein
MAGIGDRSTSYRIHFHQRDKPHIVTAGKVSEDEARSESDKLGES